MPHILAESLLSRHDDIVTAVVAVVTALLLAFLVDQALNRAYHRRPAALQSPGFDTRLGFFRRALKTGIVAIGLFIALSQFAALQEIAGTLLASSAIAAAIVGFAARQPLANGVAGMLLAFTQPLRIGDLVTFEDATGTVEDVRLTSTYLLTPGGTRIVIPNERLVGGLLRNDTSAGPAVTAEASVWIGHDADEEAALAALATALPEATASVAEVTEGGVRLAVSRQDVPHGERADTEAAMRRTALGALRTARIPRPQPGGATPPD